MTIFTLICTHLIALIVGMTIARRFGRFVSRLMFEIMIG